MKLRNSPRRGRGCTVVPLAGTWIEMLASKPRVLAKVVVPLAGTWIEIHIYAGNWRRHIVVPLAGTWIEMSRCAEINLIDMWSSPSRGRGLKCRTFFLLHTRLCVVPLPPLIKFKCIIPSTSHQKTLSPIPLPHENKKTDRTNTHFVV